MPVKVPCSKCEKEYTQTTLDKYDGLCRVCYKKKDEPPPLEEEPLLTKENPLVEDEKDAPPPLEEVPLREEVLQDEEVPLSKENPLTNDTSLENEEEPITLGNGIVLDDGVIVAQTDLPEIPEETEFEMINKDSFSDTVERPENNEENDQLLELTSTSLTPHDLLEKSFPMPFSVYQFTIMVFNECHAYGTRLFIPDEHKTAIDMIPKEFYSGRFFEITNYGKRKVKKDDDEFCNIEIMGKILNSTQETNVLGSFSLFVRIAPSDIAHSHL